MPAGLAAYSAQWDWPSSLRAKMPLAFLPASNMGLALRWQAALAELEPFFAWPSRLCNAIMLRFYEEVVRRAAIASDLELLAPSSANADCFGHTIMSLRMRHRDGRAFDMVEAAAVQKRLRAGENAEQRLRFHLGQPVEIGNTGVLRVCTSAPLVNQIADEMQTGAALSEAFAPIAESIGELFRAWVGILARHFE
jgi:predicted exporter